MDLHFQAVELIGAIAQGLHQRHGGDEGVEEVLARLTDQDLSRDALQQIQPKRVPGCRHLPEASANALGVAADVVVALVAIEDQLRWKHNASYSDETMGQAGFMDNYAYAEVIGPEGLFAGDDFLMTVLVLGPELHYRDHYHDAPELYWLLTGPTEWKRGAGGFEERRAGETLWHRPLLVHATRTKETPFLAIVIWPRDAKNAARLVKG